MARGSGGKDRTKPVVNITSPTNLSIISAGAPQLITVSATDNRAVSYVNIRIYKLPFSSSSPTNISINDVSSPYSYTWNVPNVEGNYAIEATAYDAAGNSSVHSISVKACVGSCSTTTTTTLAPPPPPPVLPSSWILAAPTPINQGSEGSCAACATACMLSVTYYYHTGATSYSQSTNIFSPEYLYDKNFQNSFNNNGCIQGDCGNGSGIIANAGIAYYQGCPLWSTLPYSTFPQGCQTNLAVSLDFCNVTIADGRNGQCHPCLLTPTIETAAANYKIKAYGYNSSADLYTMKRLIRNGHGLAIGGLISENHNIAGNGDCNYILTGPGAYTGSAHAWCIIGYDDAKQAFLLQNSWGTNWGCGGRIWVSYNYIATGFSGGYTWVTYRDDLNPYPFL